MLSMPKIMGALVLLLSWTTTTATTNTTNKSVLDSCGQPTSVPANSDGWTVVVGDTFVEYFVMCQGNQVMPIGDLEVTSLTVTCSVTDGNTSYTGGSSLTEPAAPNCQDPAVTPATLKDCNKAVTDTSTQFIAAVGSATTPTGTDCPENMASYQTCSAVCAGSEISAGKIHCFNGTMLGASFCGSKKEYEVGNQLAVRGTVIMSAKGDVDLAAVQLAIAEYLGVPADHVLVVMKEKATARRLAATGGRRLRADETLYLYEINYKVAVPDIKSSADIRAQMDALNVPSSPAAQTFKTYLTDGNVAVEGDIAASTATIKETVWKDPAANEPAIVVVPAQTNPTKTQTTTVVVVVPPAGGDGEDDKGGNAGAIVSGIIGGLVGLLAIVAGVYFFMTRKRISEA